MKENIPTTAIKLPISGKEVVVYNYLTTGENRQIQRLMISGTKVDLNTGSVGEVTGASLFETQDLAISFLVKDYNKEEIDNLPVEDGDVLYQKIQEITVGSTLTTADKKK